MKNNFPHLRIDNFSGLTEYKYVFFVCGLLYFIILRMAICMNEIRKCQRNAVLIEGDDRILFSIEKRTKKKENPTTAANIVADMFSHTMKI